MYACVTSRSLYYVSVILLQNWSALFNKSGGICGFHQLEGDLADFQRARNEELDLLRKSDILLIGQSIDMYVPNNPDPNNASQRYPGTNNDPPAIIRCDVL